MTSGGEKSLKSTLPGSDKISELIKRRGTVKGRLTLFCKFVEAFEDVQLSKIQGTEFKLRMQAAKDLYNTFNEIQCQIEELSDENSLLSQIEKRESFENSFFKVMASAECMLNMNEPNTTSKCTNNNTCPVKLPTIALPTFDGSFDRWLEFRDTYMSIIHNSNEIGDVQKFHYLRSSLTGNALQVIKSIELSDTNYVIAWELLLNRYNNNHLLIHNHVKALFTIQSISKESSSQLHKLVDTVLKNLRALKTLGEPTGSWDSLLIYLIVSKLDSITEREWEQHKSMIRNTAQNESKQKLKLDDLLKFLTNRADMLEMIKQNSSKSSSDSSKKPITHEIAHSYVISQHKPKKVESKRTPRICNFCKAGHALYTCTNFINLPGPDKIKFVDGNGLCRNCLRQGHTADDCFFGPCRQCNLKHNSLLHNECCGNDDTSTASLISRELSPIVDNNIPSTSTASNDAFQAAAMQSDPGRSVSCTVAGANHHLVQPQAPGPVLLSTAQILIAGDNNSYHTAVALLDNGSQHCFITDDLRKKLKIKTIQSTLRITGVGQSVTQSTQSCEIKVKSTVTDYNTRLNCFVLPSITAKLPSLGLNSWSLCIPNNLQLANPAFHMTSNIDLLIGADKFWELLCEGNLRLPTGPYLQNTKLGWILSGPINNNIGIRTSQTQCNFTQTLDVQLQQFWALEEVPNIDNYITPDERECEELFVKTTQRGCDGRYAVRIPLKESANTLGDTYKLAETRFHSLERKLERLPEYKKMYCDFMSEYLNLGHMTRVNNLITPNYVLPHHGVFREHSTTTKLRVVFDASASSTSGKSLNDVQHIGPTLQNDLFSILLRFRQHRYVACADVEKMYRQILIQPDQRNLQYILWRDSPSDTLGMYQLNTVTYGTASAPYLSIRCLKQLAMECGDDHIARVINDDFYVDDLITGDSSPHDLLETCTKVAAVLNTACFPLRKWVSNADIFSCTTMGDSSKQLTLGDHCQSKTLGLGWLYQSDDLHFTTKIERDVSFVSKRIMLSIVSQIYDPLGLLCPAIITAKILLQKLWLCKLGWDDLVPGGVRTTFMYFLDTLECLQSLRVPRFIMGDLVNCTHPEIHIFTDASQQAYGAAAYVRAYDRSTQTVNVQLLCAKSKVAPLKPVSIPRLELCGALVGAKLYAKIIKSLRLQFTEVVFWTDSTIVIGWLKTNPNSLKTFVQNRVVEITDMTSNARWLHVNTKDNPADLLSRGVNLGALKDSRLWWYGPTFLNTHEAVNWADIHRAESCSASDTTVELPELKLTLVSASIVNFIPGNKTDLVDFERFSSFNRLKRAFAYVYRFINNARRNNKSDRKTGPLSASEINDAVKILVRVTQKQSFPSEYQQLLNGQPKSFKRNLSGLNLFLDQENILRITGRINNSNIFDDNKKHPILLSNKHHFTILLFRSEHIRLLHAGAQLLLSTIRDSWWPLRGRDLARATVHRCVTCVRMKGKTLTPLMGNLPRERIDPGFPFIRCGVDYAGPLFILNRKGRGAKLEKCYIALFVCLTTRNIHLEAVTALSTEAYLLALKRFIARRGKPLEIFSDNGRNFVGAMNDFTAFLNSDNNTHKIIDCLANESIKFTLIPPYAPHFGGIWEAGVKSCKHHLRRVMGNAHLTYEEFSTVLVQIEAVLNSRPLSPLSADPTDLLPLTPAHFFIGRPLTASATEDLTDATTSRLPRYQRVEQMRQHFWQRWSKEYISELQTRTKWQTNMQDIALHSLVLIKEDHLPPLKWRLGRVTAVHKGPDGISRVADIYTSAGLIKRAFSKICPLPVQTEDDE